MCRQTYLRRFTPVSLSPYNSRYTPSLGQGGGGHGRHARHGRQTGGNVGNHETTPRDFRAASSKRITTLSYHASPRLPTCTQFSDLTQPSSSSTWPHCPLPM